MKDERQKKILNIIAEHSVENQTDLLHYLQEAGFDCTQATVSRDIRDLHISKQAGATGVYRYVAARKTGSLNVAEKLRTIFRESISTVDCAGNIVVLKTMPGLAGAACAAVDSMNISFIVGSIAGDDTVFLVLRGEKNAAAFVEEIRDML